MEYPSYLSLREMVGEGQSIDGWPVGVPNHLNERPGDEGLEARWRQPQAWIGSPLDDDDDDDDDDGGDDDDDDDDDDERTIES